jgi:hypothetical protein
VQAKTIQGERKNMETQADNQTQETKDNEIRDTLDQEFDGASKGTPEEWFHRARDLGAS